MTRPIDAALLRELTDDELVEVAALVQAEQRRRKPKPSSMLVVRTAAEVAADLEVES